MCGREIEKQSCRQAEQQSHEVADAFVGSSVAVSPRDCWVLSADMH